MNRVVVPSVIDVEASGFGYASYPIELGVALASGQRLSMLIKPHEDWVHWDETAEALHQISREKLESHGVDLQEVAHIFNDVLMEQTLYSDAWVVDKPWINRLYEQARVPMRFSVSPIEQIMCEHQFDTWDTTKLELNANSAGQRHRASQDALLIQQTFVATRLKIDATEAITQIHQKASNDSTPDLKVLLSKFA